MAEERLIDDDKDKKYRIRINEDGEEELEIVHCDDEEQEEVVELEDLGLDDDGDEHEFTPEELALARRKQEAEEAARRSKAEELLQKAVTLAGEGNGEYALTTLDSARRECPEMTEIYPLQLSLLTKNFSDISRFDEVLAASRDLKKYCTAESIAEVGAKLAPVVQKELDARSKLNEQLKAENEGKKAERRVRFKAAFKKSLALFFIPFVPFIALLCAAIYFSTIMFSDTEGVYLTVTIVLAALAALAFIISVILARPLARNARRVKLNESDSSTSLGRSYLEGVEQEQKLKELLNNLRAD